MTDRPRRNVAASVRQRLANAAQQSNRPFQEVLQYFAMERFLYRLSVSPHNERFVLKGALLFNVWGAPATRPTRDIDLLANLNNSVAAVLPVIRDITQQVVEPDGLVFDVDSLAGQVIKEAADYSGVRMTFLAYLENARIPMQIDIGFGDVIVPEAALTDYPVLLGLATPRLLAYPRETVVAEKFEAMVKLGQLNSRLKDFFDLWLLSRQFQFDGRILAQAVRETFANRHTTIPPPTRGTHGSVCQRTSQADAVEGVFAQIPHRHGSPGTPCRHRRHQSLSAAAGRSTLGRTGILAALASGRSVGTQNRAREEGLKTGHGAEDSRVVRSVFFQPSQAGKT